MRYLLIASMLGFSLAANPAKALTTNIRPAANGQPWPAQVHACIGAVVGWISQQPDWTAADFEIRDPGRTADFAKLVVGYTIATVNGQPVTNAFACVFPGSAATPATWNLW